jgi:hypothetical protein
MRYARRDSNPHVSKTPEFLFGSKVRSVVVKAGEILADTGLDVTISVVWRRKPNRRTLNVVAGLRPET